MSRFEPTVPPLADPQLLLYLLRRDTGGSTGQVSVVPLVQAGIAVGWDIDTIGFAYARDANLGFENRDADGFVVWWDPSDTGDPQHGGLKLSITATTFSMMWPSGVARSYAVASFRNSHQGEQLDSKLQDPTWKGVV